MSLGVIKTVAHLSFSGDFGGRENVALLLTRGMKKANIQGFLYIFIERRAGEDRISHLMSALRKIQENMRFFEEYSRFSFFLLWKMSKQLKLDNVKIVHCHCYKSLAYVLFARLLGLWKGVVLFTLHGLILKSDFRSKMIKLAQYAGMRRADGIIGCSREVLKSSLPEGWPNDQIVIINGIETTASSYEEILKRKVEAREEIISRFDLREDAFIVINVGRLTAQKNFSLFLQLIERRKKKIANDNVQYLVVGNGELYDSLRSEALSRSVNDKVVFTGFVEEIEQLYLGADLLIQTSTWEGTPMCLLEARSFGLASIIPDVGGNKDVITTGKDGFIYPSEGLKQLDDFLDLYLKSSELRQEHGRAAFYDTKSRFGVEEWVEKHLQFYCRVQEKQKW